MNDDAIDRALRDEPPVTPSPGFAHGVMRSVRVEAAHQEALPFPWKPLAGGLAATVAVALAGALTGAAPADAALAEPPAQLAQALAWLCATLAASLGLAWWPVRFAGR
ncbi:MAG: hypothetical protein ACE5EG_02085 [Thermoanaerobaculia bacterium]